MTLIIGIFTRDINDKKEIIFASDGLATIYENDKKIGQYEDVEKIRKLTPKICMGYAGKNSELFEDVYDELKNKTPKKIKKELELFTKRLHEVILKMLKNKKHRKIENELKRSKQLYQKFIVGGVFQNKLMLIRANPDNNYEILKEEIHIVSNEIIPYVAGATEKIQIETMAILEKKLPYVRGCEGVDDIIKFTISKIAERYPTEINDKVFIRRLSKRFDL